MEEKEEQEITGADRFQQSLNQQPSINVYQSHVESKEHKKAMKDKFDCFIAYKNKFFKYLQIVH